MGSYPEFPGPEGAAEPDPGSTDVGRPRARTRERATGALAGLLLGVALAPGVVTQAAEPPVPDDPTVDNQDEPADPGAVDEGEADPEDPTDVEDEGSGSGEDGEEPLDEQMLPMDDGPGPAPGGPAAPAPAPATAPASPAREGASAAAPPPARAPSPAPPLSADHERPADDRRRARKRPPARQPARAPRRVARVPAHGPEPVVPASPAPPPAAAPPPSPTPTAPIADARDVAPDGGRLHVVRAGESLWSIAERALGPAASAADVAAAVRLIWEANSRRIDSGSPDVIEAGERLVMPALPRA